MSERKELLTIKHTHVEGTLVYGTEKGDGSGKILHRLHWRGSRNLPDGAYWYLPHSRDKNAKTWKLNEAAEALREAGFEVAVGIDEGGRRSVEEIEAERAQKAEARAERYAERAERASVKGSQMWEEVRERRSHIPLGQPLLTDHYSYNADRNRRERMHRKEGRAVEEMKRGEYWAGRAEAAGTSQRHRENVPVTLRRIEKLEADLRRTGRCLDGTQYADEGPATGDYRERLLSRKRDLEEEITYWKKHVEQAKAEGVKVWSADDFSKGDFALHRGRWFEVIRVSKKSLTVPGIIDMRKFVTVKDRAYSWNDRLPYDDIQGRMSAEEAQKKILGSLESGSGRDE